MTSEDDIAGGADGGGDPANERRELWEVAWRWLWTAFSVFGAPDDVAGAGLTRRAGLRLRAWLWSIEAIVRRRRGNPFIALQDQGMAAPKPSRPRVFDAPVPPVQDAVRRSGFVLAKARPDSS